MFRATYSAEVNEPKIEPFSLFTLPNSNNRIPADISKCLSVTMINATDFFLTYGVLIKTANSC